MSSREVTAWAPHTARGGLLARWRNYAACGHSENQKLVSLLAAEPRRALDFRFNVLGQLPLGTAPHDVVSREAYWKVALGSRTLGLNAN